MMKNAFRVLQVVAVILLLSTVCRAQSAPAGGVVGSSNILNLVETFEQAYKARVGVSIVDLRTGESVLAHRGREALIPASNQKVLTSAFALSRLGLEGTFTTTVHATARDVILTGQFDPLLGDPILAQREGESIYTKLDRFVEAAKQAFGESIPGDLILASRTTPEEFHPPSWSKRHYDHWYGAPVADLNYHDNCFDVTFVEDPGAIRPVITPASRYIRIINELRLNPQGKHIWRLRESTDGGTLRLTGQIRGPAGDPLSVPMTDPRNTLGRVLADRLTRADVRVGGRLRILPAGRVNLEQTKRITKNETPLTAVLHRANKRSLNLAAECMLLRAGDGTWAGSTKQMHDTLVKEFHLDAETLSVHDGSGLSRDNRVTPDDMTKILVTIHRSENGKKFLTSLPVSGMDGSLKKRLKQEPYRGRVAAKTGTLWGVRALSGYILEIKGNPVFAFSILANDLKGRAQSRAKQLQDQICAALIDAME